MVKKKDRKGRRGEREGKVEQRGKGRRKRGSVYVCTVGISTYFRKGRKKRRRREKRGERDFVTVIKIH